MPDWRKMVVDLVGENALFAAVVFAWWCSKDLSP